MKPADIFVILVFFFSNTSIAQEDSSSKKSFIKFNVNYLTNAVYFARKDSSPVPYLRSSITYNDKSGFYVSGGMALLVSSSEPARIDLINLDGGYNFSIGKVDAGLYASKFFYSNASYAVNSELKGMAGFYLGYTPGIISLGAGGYMMFSTNTDIGTYVNLSHTIEQGEENNHWTFVPTVQANAGTQYFNEAYYEFRKFTFPTTASNSGSNSGSGNGNGSGKGSGKGHSNSSNSGSGSGGGTTTTTVKTVTFYDRNRFTLLDVELSVPINYETKRWGVYANPVVAFPTNAATFAIDNAIQKEKLSTVFFAEIGAYLKF
jgi:hypothetical protein